MKIGFAIYISKNKACDEYYLFGTKFGIINLLKNIK